MAIPVLSNVAGAAQAQRHNAYNQKLATDNARQDARTAWLRDLGGTFLNAGLSAAMQFGGKAYDEATSGKREQQRIDNDERQQNFARSVDRITSDIDAPGYDLTRKVAEPGYGIEGEMGKGRMERAGPDTGLSAAEGSPLSREMGPRQSRPGDMRPVSPTEALASIPNVDDRMGQEALNRRRSALADAALAQQREAEYKRRVEADKFNLEAEKALIESQSKAAANIKNLAPSRYTVPPYKATPGEGTPKFGLQRVDFGPQSRAAPVGGGRGSGGAAPVQAVGPLAEPVEIIAAREGRRGDPTTGSPTRTFASRGEWAAAAIKKPSKYGLTPAEAAQVAQGLRVATANASDPTKEAVVADAVAKLDAARKASIARMGPLIAQAGEALTTSPADMAVAEGKAAEKVEAGKAAAADREKQIELAKLTALESLTKIDETATDRAVAIASKLRPTERAMLSASEYASAMMGTPPPSGLTPDQAKKWAKAAAEGAEMRTARDTLRRVARQKAAATYRALGVDVED